MQDIALLPILVLHERDARAAVGIVLDLLHDRLHPEAIALEVDDAVLALVTAAAAAHRDVPVVVPAPRLDERLGERLLGRAPRDLRKIRDRSEPRALRDWLELAN